MQARPTDPGKAATWDAIDAALAAIPRPPSEATSLTWTAPAWEQEKKDGFPSLARVVELITERLERRAIPLREVVWVGRWKWETFEVRAIQIVDCATNLG